MIDYAAQLDAIDLAEEKLKAKRMRVLEKAIRSDSPNDIVKASRVINAIENKQINQQEPKAYFIDPLQFNSNLGYKDKMFSLTYETLRRMAKTPIINSIIKTRKNQVADFAEPQENKYSTGFVIRKKMKNGEDQEMTDDEKKIAYQITEFLMRGGKSSSWEVDDFDTFIRKITEDSLTYDQMTFEIIRNRRGEVDRFIATDASTFRISDTYFNEDYDNPYFSKRGSMMWNDVRHVKKEHGYYPAYVQVYQNNKVEEFYPWELCFGVRNPSTNIYANGYGCSELEDLINVVTSMLWGDEYNRRFFSQGSAPKGLLRVKGVNNEAALQQFRQQWQSMISGVYQSWKTPVVQADVDWIDLQKNNRDMEYNAWMEYLIKQACAIYSIDPTEIGWDIARSGSNSGLFEGSQAERLQHSKDKGLYPLLKFLQRKINKYIVEQINPDFELVFMGLNGMTISEELDMDVKKINSFQTINEIREKWGLEPLEYGDMPENSIYYQAKQAATMNQQQQGMGMMEGGAEEQNPFAEYEEETVDEEEYENPYDAYKAHENTLLKAFENYLTQEEYGSN
jgi:hypothetical protein